MEKGEKGRGRSGVLKGRVEKRENRGQQEKKNKVKAVIFTPFTTDSELAKSIRQAKERLEVLTGYRLKVGS